MNRTVLEPVPSTPDDDAALSHRERAARDDEQIPAPAPADDQPDADDQPGVDDQPGADASTRPADPAAHFEDLLPGFVQRHNTVQQHNTES
jgi:hypothetical protein